MRWMSLGDYQAQSFINMYHTAKYNVSQQLALFFKLPQHIVAEF